ncbi:hypothetical protein Nit79A3_1113 [Nitrosomonas sp. Is79A3]|uniref:hypothetical protein n=1 Tax=Nitrosomonas sp. (strain Is79A3) TaxID=261292 RepID=UPI000215C9D1
MRIKIQIIHFYISACLSLLFLLSGGSALAVNGNQISLSESATDLTSLFKVDRSGLVFNRSTNTYDSIISITNKSNQQIQLPVALVILDTPAGVSVNSPSGITLEGNPYLIAGSSGQSLSFEESLTIKLKYSNPSRFKISSTFRILAFPIISDDGLGGSDNNNNGVRDAIEANVTFHFNSSARQQAAAFQVLAAYRTALLNQGTVQEAFDSVSNYFKAEECMKNIMGAFTGNYEAYKQGSNYLRNIMLDNKDRIKAWLQLGDMAAGQVFSDPVGQPCTFDSSSLPN